MYVDELNFLPPEYDSGLLITALWPERTNIHVSSIGTHTHIYIVTTAMEQYISM